ncbi:hypothetical protein BDQ94DRAFT_158901 [Aspergillus welwitschiae]|uniref:Aminoglycoside phosphotransferase domain-containing protein n=1 Tax=Aspergillus welwitschiae TaxID=1341132 RepID=A0A3F3Q5H8_9EURO|nr:hypothetical protein BDQ94DRAFT_158901 [Aspergillus welwitschiae]RDH34494.1 hypothetical protein BDQ94DRAFT_158901 [Aspergillus welwitschiae]
MLNLTYFCLQAGRHHPNHPMNDEPTFIRASWPSHSTLYQSNPRTAIPLNLKSNNALLQCQSRQQHLLSHRLEHPRCILQNHAWPLSRRRSREPPHARDQIRHERLARIAAEWMGATHCTSIQKYPDGMFNKAFLMSMDNGREVVAKVPNPNSGIPRLTTASEVATMNFVYPTTSINAGSS